MNVVVTGAAGGIGSAIVETFLAEGHEVFAADQAPCEIRQTDAGNQAPREVCQTDAGNQAPRQTPETDAPGRLHTFTVDLKDPVALEAFATEITACRQVDILINAAGVFVGGPATELTCEEWDELFLVNTRAVFLLSRLMGTHMAARGGGSIVTVASNSAVIPRARMAAYGASKAAASILTRSLGLELGPSGVRCNVVNPGTTRTGMIAGLGSEEQIIAGLPEQFKAGIPLGRIATPADIAHAVHFAATAQHLNCAEITIDGGASGC